MPIAAKYAHTNLVARDWQQLAAFYEAVLGCVPVPPERDLSGPAIERATGVPGARLRGGHWRLPGGGPDGPTLEIFEYDPPGPDLAKPIHRPGFGHLAFVVDDVDAAVDAVRAAGGGTVGAAVSVTVPGAGVVQFAYVTDPEGNVIEVQAWTPATPGDR